MVTLSPDAKIANVSKPTQDSKVAYGKLIKKVLNRYFDNDNIATDLMEDKKTNLNQLVEELGKEQYCKYKAPRKKAMKLMRKDAIAKYKVMQQSIREEENENRKFFNLYLNQFQDWCDLESLGVKPYVKFHHLKQLEQLKSEPTGSFLKHKLLSVNKLYKYSNFN